MIWMRVALALVGAVLLTGCASASYISVKKTDTPGPCVGDVPARDLLFGVALSGGGSRAALFAEASLEALAGLRTADGVSALDKINHVSDRKSTRLNSSHLGISYAVLCLK